MKLYLVFVLVISVFLSSCTPSGPTIEQSGLGSVDQPYPFPTETISMKISSEKDLDYSSIFLYERNSFKQLLRIGDGSLSLIDYHDSYPFKEDDQIKMSIHAFGQESGYQTINPFFADYEIEFFEKNKNYLAPQSQPKYPIAYFHIQDQELEHHDVHTFLLRYLLTDSNKAELWLSCTSLDFLYKIDDTNLLGSPIAPILPASYYNKAFDYFNGWLVYAKGSDIHLVNLYAEISLLAKEGKMKNLSGLKQKRENSLLIDLDDYQNRKENMVLREEWSKIFQARSPMEWKRMLHLHELDDYMLLSMPSNQQTDIIYVFEKHFSSPPSFIEFQKDHYRIYRGSKTANDHPKILLMDTFLNNIEIYNIVTNKSFHIDASQILSLSDRAIHNAYLSSIDSKQYLFFFPTEYMSNQSSYFIVIELDMQMNPSHKYKVSFEDNPLYHHFQVIHRSQENDFVLLSKHKESNQFVLSCFSVEKKIGVHLDYKFFRMPFFDAKDKNALMMFYAPGGYFVLQIKNYFNKGYLEANFFDLKSIDMVEEHPIANEEE